MGNALSGLFRNLYQFGAVKRTIIVWLLFQSVLWVFFGAGYLLQPDSWVNVPTVAPSSAAVGGVGTTIGYIVLRNSIVLLLIGAGNLFVRFWPGDPRLLVLAVGEQMAGLLEPTV